MSNQTLLKMEEIEKNFNGCPVLKKVNFEVESGEVHALMGENGAGKSTLIKILTGIYPKDGGRIIFDGEEVHINNRSDAIKLGIGVIYQELSLIPTLTVVQNIMLGKEKEKFGFVQSKKMREEVIELINKYNFGIKPDAIVETLTIAQRQTVEILKALSEKSKLIIMDEPTASLSSKESEALFKIIEQLKEQGVSIIYISHRLEEVYRLSDRLTVLRDGVREALLNREEINPSDVIRLMIGKDLSESTASNNLRVANTPVKLKVVNLEKKGVFKNISFELHEGEILGFAGLVGAGRTEVMRCIYGADPIDSGTVTLDGKELPRSIGKNIELGFGLVPEDRRNQGFTPLLSIEKNVALTNYDTLAVGGFVKEQKEKTLGNKMVDALGIRPNNSQIPVGNLSGGNQQKAVLAKWLSRDLKVLIIDEPTAGIDVGAKDEIYKIIESIAKNGASVIMVSSDLQELLRVSQRIIVMRKGEIFTEFSSGKITQEDILMAESGILTKEAENNEQ
ncbi:monosaccharide ABC transporter ATP-binding protein (CUT2 family) [Lachnotalea glycerini]|uniref:Monosaccharide ABC transporter ATP-binding protein (CUT2 family) n=1 Tax=Lachnotalea glycerini TaxID=1763509 RepID=A0A255IUF4_9FIRM|nr:sugar ABC transporter ATP-binding protein [Lachnotalea glycerini]PXV85612.1 monosaccharide ABC transporter ATP-binding protein (CUT2 family) [Lachnotalea glycerini]RDY31147.1 sugar ABC transporter ATP-binding protein [Lachnotalea glycerini]